MPISERENIFPSGANLVAVKARLSSVKKGFSMLQHKRDAIEIKVRDLKQKMEMLDIMKKEALQEGLMHMARARYYGTKFEPYLVAQTKFADTYLINHTTRVVGINIPMFHFKTETKNQYRFAGLSGGAEEAQIARRTFLELLELLISIASIKFSLSELEPALKQTKTRCNAAEYVVIPKLEATKDFILEALDEQEREDFYRLKCSKAKQIKHRQNQYRNYVADSKTHMADFLTDSETMPPEDLEIIRNDSVATNRQTESLSSTLQANRSIEIQPETASETISQMKPLFEEYFSREVQTDKPSTRTMETQTSDLPVVATHNRNLVPKKSYRMDTSEITTDSALNPEDSYGPRLRKRLKGIPKDVKNLQTDE